MKKLMMSVAVAVLAFTSIQAQENKTVKQESTIKRVVTKEGSKVNVKEIKKTDTESGAVIVKDDNKTNQEFREVNQKDSANKVLVDDVNVDGQNEAMIARKKMEQQAQLEVSIKEQSEMAAKRKLEYQAKQELKQKELAERRAQLTARPKGMAKLKRD